MENAEGLILLQRVTSHLGGEAVHTAKAFLYIKIVPSKSRLLIIRDLWHE